MKFFHRILFAFRHWKARKDSRPTNAEMNKFLVGLAKLATDPRDKRLILFLAGKDEPEQQGGPRS